MEPRMLRIRLNARPSALFVFFAVPDIFATFVDDVCTFHFLLQLFGKLANFTIWTVKPSTFTSEVYLTSTIHDFVPPTMVVRTPPRPFELKPTLSKI